MSAEQNQTTPPTRSFAQTVRDRAAVDPEFAQALVDDEDVSWARLLLADELEGKDAVIARLRAALENYACPGIGACPAPWVDGKCTLEDDCGLIAAIALAGTP